MDKKSHKPTRKELLDELESIRSSLLPSGGASGDEKPDTTAQQPQSNVVFTRPETALYTEQDYLLPLPNNDEITDVTSGRNVAKEDTSELMSNTQKNDSQATNVLPGQQSLFGESSSSVVDTKTTTAAGSDDSSTKGSENPFLPKHIKDRLEREKSLYQKEIEAATKLPGLSPEEGAPEDQNDALIEELVEHYLPIIAQELRERLRNSLSAPQSTTDPE